MRIYWITEFQKGNLGMMARPRGNDWLEGEIKKLKLSRVDAIISLLEKHEIRELKIEKEKVLCEENNIEFIHFPVRDRSVPSDKNAFTRLISIINLRLKENKKVVIHCRMGIGRTAIFAAGVLIQNGFKANEVFDFLSEKRALTVPAEEQIRWIRSITDQLQSTRTLPKHS